MTPTIKTRIREKLCKWGFHTYGAWENATYFDRGVIGWKVFMRRSCKYCYATELYKPTLRSDIDRLIRDAQ